MTSSQKPVVFFLTKNNNSIYKNYRKLKAVYGEKTMPFDKFECCYNKFKQKEAHDDRAKRLGPSGNLNQKPVIFFLNKNDFSLTQSYEKLKAVFRESTMPLDEFKYWYDRFQVRKTQGCNEGVPSLRLLTDLNQDCLEHIFSKLDFGNECTVRQVCQSFKNVPKLPKSSWEKITFSFSEYDLSVEAIEEISFHETKTYKKRFSEEANGRNYLGAAVKQCTYFLKHAHLNLLILKIETVLPMRRRNFHNEQFAGNIRQFISLLSAELKLRKTKLHVTAFQVTGDLIDYIFPILAWLEPGNLKMIETRSQMYFSTPSNINHLLETEQWKQATQASLHPTIVDMDFIMNSHNFNALSVTLFDINVEKDFHTLLLAPISNDIDTLIVRVHSEIDVEKIEEMYGPFEYIHHGFLMLGVHDIPDSDSSIYYVVDDRRIAVSQFKKKDDQSAIRYFKRLLGANFGVNLAFMEKRDHVLVLASDVHFVDIPELLRIAPPSPERQPAPQSTPQTRPRSRQPHNHERAASSPSSVLILFFAGFRFTTMHCDDDGTCYREKNGGFLGTLVETFESGTPCSAFVLATELCLCLTFFISIPNIRKDSIFWLVAIVFAPFLVKTSVEVAHFFSIYYYTSAYTYWTWVHDSVVSFCYSSFLFNFQYGMVIYSCGTVMVAMKKRKISKGYTRWPYITIFFVTLIQSALFYQIMVLGLVSMLLILLLAPVTIASILVASCCCKSLELSELNEIRRARSIMLWNIPCLLLTMFDVGLQLYLTNQWYSYYANAFHNKELIFSILYPPVAILIMFITLPALRRSVFPCCYSSTNEDVNSDKMFLITRDSISGASPAPSENSSINTITQQVVPYQNNVPTAFNQVAPYPYFTMPNVYPQSYPQSYPQGFPNGQPLYVPIPITFYNPTHMSTHQNELPIVQ